MRLRFSSRIQRYRSQMETRYRYFSRIGRARTLQLLLKACLVAFRIEVFFRPLPKRDHKRVLVIVIGGLGDCLLFDPLFRRLKEQWPGIRIDVLSGSFEQLWVRMAPVDNLMLFTPTKFKTPWSYVKLFHTIFRNRYDVVAEGIAFLPKRGVYPVFTSLVFSASAAPVRIGRPNVGHMGSMHLKEMGFMGRDEMHKRKTSKRPAANPFLTHVLNIAPPERRVAHESAYVFEPLGVPYHRRPHEPLLVADPPNDVWAADRLDQHWPVDDHRPLVGITLETTRAIKSWPIENYLAVIDKGIGDGFRFLLLGLDRSPARQIVHRLPGEAVWDLTGQTTLAQMIALIQMCDVFVSADTGPSHIAQASRVPTVVLFGPSNEREFGPVDNQLHTLMLPPEPPACRPCVLGPCVRGRSCVQTIRPEDVYAALIAKVDLSACGDRRRPQRLRDHPQRILCVI